MAMKRLVLALVLSASATAAAEEPPPPGLYSPGVIMNHQQELALTDGQRAAIVKEVQATQSRVLEIQWQMSGAMEALAQQLKAPRVDEAKALAGADKVLGFEREVKRTQLLLLIRLKNILTEPQQTRAKDLQGRSP
jgi:Spy/CpxP family protein refolding chaperone